MRRISPSSKSWFTVVAGFTASTLALASCAPSGGTAPEGGGSQASGEQVDHERCGGRVTLGGLFRQGGGDFHQGGSHRGEAAPSSACQHAPAVPLRRSVGLRL